MIIGISLVVIYFFSPYRRFFHILIIISVILLTILYFNLGFVKVYLDRIVSMVLGNYDDSISTRGHLFWQGFQIGLDHFFFGIGLEGFPVHYVHQIPFTQLSWEIIASHNVLITLFAELGFMGPLLYLSIFYYYFKLHGKEIRSMTPSLFKALYFSSVLIVLMYFQFFLFNTPYFDENNFWIFWGVSFLFWKTIQSEKIPPITLC
ncbi:MAG: O-antigen ligase family protein [Candidatus Delongbacteria bacterium]|nr:O-antigen ligase family protein [Candidatus Delongbacteria bacterium]